MSYTIEDFVDALDTKAFIELFTEMGFEPVPGAGSLFVRRRQHGRHAHTDMVAFHNRDAVLCAAQTYTEITGIRLWWLPQTDTEAMYASLLLTLLYSIRFNIEDPDGSWGGADVVDLLCLWFYGLGLDVNAELPDNATPQDFLQLTLAPAAARLKADLEHAPTT